jgi:hypothetical protein
VTNLLALDYRGIAFQGLLCVKLFALAYCGIAFETKANYFILQKNVANIVTKKIKRRASTNYDFFRKYFQAIIKDTKDHPSIRFPNSKSMNFSTLLKLVWKTQTLPSQDKVNCHVTLKQFY